MDKSHFLKNYSAKFFRHFRLHTNLTQADMASAIGKSQSYISKLEKGLLEPTISEWFSFCDKFKVSLDSLLKFKKSQSNEGKKLKSTCSVKGPKRKSNR